MGLQYSSPAPLGSTRRDQSLPDIPPRRFLSTIQAPAAEALDLLSAHSPAIFAAWEREVRELGLKPDDFLEGHPPNLTRFADLLRESTYPVFRQQLQSLGARLAKRGAKLGNTVAATNRLFEICLPYLIRDVPKRATPLLARLHALARSADHVRIHGPVGGRRENAGGG